MRPPRGRSRQRRAELGPEPLDAGNVLQRTRDREGRRVAVGEGATVLGKQALAFAAAGGKRDGEAIVPVAQDVGDAALQVLGLYPRRGALVAADDELHPHQRTVGEVGIERGDTALVGLGQKGADALAHLRGVALARRVDDDRHEAIEAVDAGEHAHARARLEVEDALGPLDELVGLDLEQLVARERLEHVQQGLARMAGGRVARNPHDRFHFVAQERDVARRPDIGLRGEQADEAHLAVERAVGAIGFDADVVHVHAPVHAAHHVRLGDDERRGREVEAADLGRQVHELGTAPEHMHGRVAQHAEPSLLHRHQLAGLGRAVEPVGAHAEEGEVARLQPAQEGDGLAQLAGRHARRPCLQALDGATRLLEHGAPVADGYAHLAQDVGQRLGEIALVRLRQAVEMDCDVAFLLSVAPVLVAGPEQRHAAAPSCRARS